MAAGASAVLRIVKPSISGWPMPALRELVVSVNPVMMPS